MKVYPEKFNDHLMRGLKPVYVITGEEPLQVNECCDLVREHARQEGFDERIVYSVDIDTGCDEFLQASDTLSLFAEKKLLEVRLPKGKTGRDWAQALNTWLDRPPEDTLLLVSGHKLERGVASTAWYKKADKLGITVQTWAKNPQQLVSWINRTLQQNGLRASRSAVGLIAQRVEGNMLAAEQEIRKLALLFPDAEIGDSEVITSVANSSRYSPFDLTHAALDGNAARAARILQVLRGEGVADALIHWALTQDVKLLLNIAQSQLSGAAPDTAIGKARVPRNRIPLVKKALNRHTERHWLQMAASCSRLERMIKGRESGDVWSELLELALFIAGRKLTIPDNKQLLGGTH